MGVALLQTGFDGSRVNLEAKLSSFIDTAYVTSVVDGIARLSEETRDAARAAESWLRVPPA
jgi:hypothetical protein